MYNIVINGEEIELPKYSVDIAEKLAKPLPNALKQRYKAMYYIVQELTNNALDSFDDCDINEIENVYTTIKYTYDKPNMDLQYQKASDVLEHLGEFEKVANIVDALEKANKLKF